MTKNLIKKSIIAGLAVLVLGSVSLPLLVQAKEGKDKNRGNSFGLMIAKMAKIGEAEDEKNGLYRDGVRPFLNEPSIRPAITVYHQAVKEAKKTYKTAVKAARERLVSAFAAAGNNLSARLTAIKQYLSEVLTALKLRNSAKEAALQALINAIPTSPTNNAPVANAQSVTLAKNTSKVITLTGSDIEGSSLSYFVVTNPVHGTLSGTVPTLTYMPDTDFTGTDSFTFRVNDGSLNSPTATVSITVTP